MTEEQIKKLIPDLKQNRYIGDVFSPKKEEWQKQTEDLRKAVDLIDRMLSADDMEIFKDDFEDIFGIPYSEIGQ